MLYTTITIGGIDYKARLNAKACVELEKKLGTNPLNVYSKIATDGSLPDLGTMIIILQASLSTLNHGITLDKAYELYDTFIEDGNTMMDLVPIIFEVFKVSGLFKEEEDTIEKKKKN